MRRRIRKEFTWLLAIGNWQLTNEVHYVYDGNLVIQERWLDSQLSNLNAQQSVSYTRGQDFANDIEGAGAGLPEGVR